MIAWRQRLRRAFYELRLEGEGRGREAAALGLGLLIGCVPVYGFHLLLCWVVGRLLRLNRLKMYVAANISNPLFSPFLLFAELQTGAFVRRRDLHDLTLEAIRHTNPWTFGADLVIGSLVVGAVLGLSVAIATFVTGGLRHEDAALATLWQRASDPYLSAGIAPWEFARGKLRGDPVYRALLQPGVISSGGTLVDLGCGTGLTLSMLTTAARMHSEGTLAAVPRADRLVGVELRGGAARIARDALGADAEIVEADARAFPLPPSRTVLLFDVLHMIPRDDQDRLLARIASALEPGGAILIREADADGGVRFQAVRLGNRLKALATGNWRQRFTFRAHDEWAAALTRLGLEVTAQSAGEGTPFANSLVVGRRRGGSALHERAEVHDGVDRAAARVVGATKPEAADRG